MTDEQKELFRTLYNFIHDEMALVLRGVVVPYLNARQRTGAMVMELMYELEGKADGHGNDNAGA